MENGTEVTEDEDSEDWEHDKETRQQVSRSLNWQTAATERRLHQHSSSSRLFTASTHYSPPAVASAKPMTEAAMNIHLEVVKWRYDEEIELFHSNTGEAGAMDTAAKFGHLDVLQYLHELHVSADSRCNKSLRNSDELRCAAASMADAARNGHLEVVRWLHQNRNEGCSSLAIDAAASGGDLQIVQWLDVHRSEGGTVAAMDGAARNGHLEMIKWLRSHRSEGCSANAMDAAAGNGDLEIVQWLHENTSACCSTKAMEPRWTDILKR